MKKNKVKFNLKKVHYARLSITDGLPVFDNPEPIPGAVSLSMSPNGDVETFYSSDVEYAMSDNKGYDGDLEIALVPEEFAKYAFGEVSDSKNVLTEKSDSLFKPFALLFEFDGDKRHIRHVIYNCTVRRHDISSHTREERSEIQIEKIHFVASPLPGGLVKCKTGDHTKSAVYDRWFSSVYFSTLFQKANLTSLSISNLDISPAFSPNVYAYAAITTSDTSVLTVAGRESSEIQILFNGRYINSGETLTWLSGVNKIAIIVKEDKYQNASYSINVTKLEE